MTSAAQKATALEKDAAAIAATETPAEVSDTPSSTPPTPPPAKRARAKAAAKLDLAEEQRTANLIAVLALGPAAWSDLYAAGIDADTGSEEIAQLVVQRLGLVGEDA